MTSKLSLLHVTKIRGCFFKERITLHDEKFNLLVITLQVQILQVLVTTEEKNYRYG